MNIVNITSEYAVAGSLRSEDFAQLARDGFRTVICFQTETETTNLLRPDEARRLAISEGLNFVHIPTPKHELLSTRVVGEMRETLKTLEGPVLGSCTSGQRAAIAWAAARARVTPEHELLATLSAAGFEFDFLRDELRMLAGKNRVHDERPCAQRDLCPPQALA